MVKINKSTPRWVSANKIRWRQLEFHLFTSQQLPTSAKYSTNKRMVIEIKQVDSSRWQWTIFGSNKNNKKVTKVFGSDTSWESAVYRSIDNFKTRFGYDAAADHIELLKAEVKRLRAEVKKLEMRS